MQTNGTAKLLRVGELAKAAGKTVRALHLYEELGLLTPASRSTGGFRLYGPDAVERVGWIQKLQDMGFSLPEIQGFLRDYEGSASGPAGMARVRAIFADKLRETREQLGRLAALEKDLAASLGYLETCNTCETSHTVSECSGCGHHGHDPITKPDLIAGLKESPRTASEFHVPLQHLTEGNR